MKGCSAKAGEAISFTRASINLASDFFNSLLVNAITNQYVYETGSVLEDFSNRPFHFEQLTLSASDFSFLFLFIS